MATDIAVVLANLTRFYDFAGKTVVHVGAGGGQFIAYASVARRVVAVDPDADAVVRLKAAIHDAGLASRFDVRQTPFELVTDPVDVVFFEFCLHEMDDPDGVLQHARTLAPEIVVIDHAPDSPWSWWCEENAKAARSWAAVDRAGVRRSQDFAGWQRFPNREALCEKVNSAGPVAVSRAMAYAGPVPIEIVMTYRAVLL